MEVPKWLPASLPAVVVIRHGADTARISSSPEARTQAREPLGLLDVDHVVRTVGNFAAKKNHARLLRAISQLISQGRPARAVLVGTRPLEPELRDLAGSPAIESRVTFTGMRDDVHELLCAFDVFVLSSRYEELPIPLLEAMAVRVPVVATRVGGIPEVITDRCDGVPVTPGDPRALALASADVSDDSALRLRLGEAAATRSVELDLPGAVARTQALYDAVLVCP